MNTTKVSSRIDYSILWQNSSRDSVIKRCQEALEYGFACIACLPIHVSLARSIVGDRASVTAAIGFPLGGSTTKNKIHEALDAMDNGANEIDVVMNISWFKDGYYDAVLNELKQIVKETKIKKEDCTVKVIIETPHLKQRSELKTACEIVIESGADYIKEATGFACGYDGTGSANYNDEMVTPFDNTGVNTIKEIFNIVNNKIKIKPSGDLQNLDDCLYCIEAFGVSRIGNDNVPQWLDDNNEK